MDIQLIIFYLKNDFPNDDMKICQIACPEFIGTKYIVSYKNNIREIYISFNMIQQNDFEQYNKIKKEYLKIKEEVNILEYRIKKIEILKNKSHSFNI